MDGKMKEGMENLSGAYLILKQGKLDNLQPFRYDLCVNFVNKRYYLKG
jgi:hypothetical protein